jgi:hypothetical protein
MTSCFACLYSVPGPTRWLARQWRQSSLLSFERMLHQATQIELRRIRTNEECVQACLRCLQAMGEPKTDEQHYTLHTLDRRFKRSETLLIRSRKAIKRLTLMEKTVDRERDADDFQTIDDLFKELATVTSHVTATSMAKQVRRTKQNIHAVEKSQLLVTEGLEQLESAMEDADATSSIRMEEKEEEEEPSIVKHLRQLQLQQMPDAPSRSLASSPPALHHSPQVEALLR